ncbi:MAG: TRAP transporter small permease [Albidovulum sp.]|nr:TRAP transporter small permease [Albidovulum sp.]MDE0306279.1 TRAP transporter small permease [Albidovulum sp.]MDE0531321.1 TRAP transporter small permease [Albidovulum sp.]
MSTIRKCLDWLYLVGGAIGALFLIFILCIICAQMVARWTGTTFPGSTNYAGYCMAASTFFALAYALNHGAHIRVSLFLGKMGKYRRLGEIWCYAIAGCTMTFFAWYAFERNLQTKKFKFMSQGLDATPLWIPEISMTVGATLFAIALWDHLIRIVFTDHMGIDKADASRLQE